MDLQTQAEIQDEVIEGCEQEPEININEIKSSFTIADFANDICPYCHNRGTIRSDYDRPRYCHTCGAKAKRIVNEKPVTEQEMLEGQMYRRHNSKRDRPLHEFTCQYPGCGEKYQAHKAGKCTRKYCDAHTAIAIGNAHTRAGMAKRRLAHEANSPSDCVGLTL